MASDHEVSLSCDNQIQPEQDEQSQETTQKSEQMDTSNTTAAKSHSTQLPLARVKNIMKFDPDVSLAGSETVYLIAKCTEMFIARLTESAYQHTVQGKRKTIRKQDIEQSITTCDCFSFLEGILDKSTF